MFHLTANSDSLLYFYTTAQKCLIQFSRLISNRYVADIANFQKHMSRRLVACPDCETILTLLTVLRLFPEQCFHISKVAMKRLRIVVPN